MEKFNHLLDLEEEEDDFLKFLFLLIICLQENEYTGFGFTVS